MARKIVCDKCGKMANSVEEYARIEIEARFPGDIYVHKDLDICEECIFERFNPLDLIIKTDAGRIQEI